VERSLALIAGAGVLPGRAAAEARRQGWRVVAFGFEDAPGLAEASDAFIPSRLTDIQSVILELASRRVSSAVFVGKFWKQRAFEEADRADEAARRLARGGLSDAALAEMVVATLEGMSIDVLDPRQLLAPWMLPAGVLTARAPSPEEWTEIRSALTLARHLASYGIGQTVVRCLGVTVAVEAIEGTDEAIRRGTRLSGPGAIVVKGVAPGHDFRFDVPTIGPATLEVMAEGEASVLAVEGGKLLLVDREEVIRRADAAGIAVVSVDAEA
jgi:DUF1009 family protein